VQLRRGVAVDRSRTVMLERRRGPAPGRDRRMIATDARLNVAFEFPEGDGDTLAVCLADAVVAADQGRQGHALRRGERRVPAGAVRHRLDGLAATVGGLVRGLMLDERRVGDRVPPIGEALEVALVHRAFEAPLARELALPLAANLIALRVVVVTRIPKLFGVIVLRLRGTEGFGD